MFKVLCLALFVFVGGCLCVPIPLCCVLACVYLPSRMCMLVSLMGPQQHLYNGKIHTSIYTASSSTCVPWLLPLEVAAGAWEIKHLA